MNARPALSGGAFTAGFAVCNPNNAGWVVANTTNLASGAVDIGGIALETAVSGGASVQVLTAGYCPPEVIGTLSGTGDWVQVGSTGALSRGTSVTSATIGKYQSDGGVIVNLSLQSALIVAALYDSGYVLVSDYGATDAALAAADAVAQGYTPPKRLLATEQITLSNNVTVASEMVFEGGSITAASAKTLTMPVPTAPRTKIVFGSALLLFADATPGTGEIYPEWFGAKGDGIVFAANVTSGSAVVTSTSGLFTSAMAGRPIVVFSQVNLTRYTVGTVATYTDPQHVSMSLVSAFTDASARGYCATDDQAAIRAAIVASRGNSFISLLPNRIYGLGSSLVLSTTTGRGLKLRGNWSTLVAVASIPSGGVVTTDPGAAQSTLQTDAHITELVIDGANVARDGWFAHNETYPQWAAGIVGYVAHIRVQSVQRFAFKMTAAQVGHYEKLHAFSCGDSGFALIACNGATFNSCRVSGQWGLNGSSTSLGTAKPAVLIDSYANPSDGSNGYGSGDLVFNNFVFEIGSGHGVHIKDTAGNSGTTVAFYGGHMEGVAQDGFYVERENTIIDGVAVGGGGAYAPVRVTSSGDGTIVRGITWAGFASGATVVETGATNCIVEANYSPTGAGAFTDPSVADGWAGKLQFRRGAGDVHLQGTLWIGASGVLPAPSGSEAAQIDTGTLRLGKGNVTVDLGEFACGHGGIGRGQNLLLHSEDITNAAWTKGSDTSTTAAYAQAPDGTTTACRLFDDGTATGSNVSIQRDSNCNTLLGYASLNGHSFVASFWAKSNTGSSQAWTATLSNVGGANITVQSLTIDTVWRRYYVTGTSADAVATSVRIRIGSTATGAITAGTLDLSIWGLHLEPGDGLEALKPGPYRRTTTTAAARPINGPVGNTRTLGAAGTFTAAAGAANAFPGGTVAVAGAVVTVTDTRVTARTVIRLTKTNAAAVALGDWYVSARTLDTSFAITFPGAPAGTETYEYTITEPTP